jgi:hypothetical protein
MLDRGFTRRLEADSRTAWARHRDDEQLAGLIWALGDLSYRSRVLTEQLDEHRAEIDPDDTDVARARALLQRLSDLVKAPWLESSGVVWRPIADALEPGRSPARQAGPIFANEFCRQLEESKGKYFRWALTLTEDHLFAILATIGELAPLMPLIAAQLDRHQGEVFIRIAYARARTVLEIIAEMDRGIRFTFGEVHSRIGLAIKKARELSHRPGNWWTG